MKLSNEEIAASLLNRLHQHLSHKPELEQVDFYDCAQDDPDSVDTMAYVYLADGDCVPMCFRTPPFFEPHEVEVLMLRGRAAVVVN